MTGYDRDVELCDLLAKVSRFVIWCEFILAKLLLVSTDNAKFRYVSNITKRGCLIKKLMNCFIKNKLGILSPFRLAG